EIEVVSFLVKLLFWLISTAPEGPWKSVRLKPKHDSFNVLGWMSRNWERGRFVKHHPF
ncbi:MAG: hypothetical protein ACJAX8_002132, partial [Flavobacteriales bacterium]